MTDIILKFIASGAFISYIPTAILKNKKNTGAGFLGTCEGVLLYVFLMPRNFALYAFALAAFIIFASYVADKVNFGQKDSPKIIIDEIAGYFTAAAFLPRNGFVLLLAFVFFRIFDSFKISFIKKAEGFGSGFAPETKKKYCTEGFAVVLDDLAAGLAANLIIQLILLLKLL
jgi:Phosphatidylglycerophosphatase A and related proteins